MVPLRRQFGPENLQRLDGRRNGEQRRGHCGAVAYADGVTLRTLLRRRLGHGIRELRKEA